MKKMSKICVSLAVAGALFFTGCGSSSEDIIINNGNTNPVVIEHIVVPNAGSSNVAVKSLNLVDGSTTDVAQAAAGTTPRMVKTHPNQAFAYVSNQTSGDISAYSIAANGTLTPVAGSPFAGPAGAVAVTVDPTGRFLYAAGTGNQIRSYSIDATGGLTNPVNLPMTSVPTVVAPVFTRTVNGLFLNVAGTNGGVATVETFTVNEQTGALSPNSISSVAGGTHVDGLSLHPSGTVLVAAVEDLNTANSSSLLPLTLNANGSLNQVNGSQVPLNFDCGNTAMSVAGTVYIGSDSSNNVAAFTVNGASGATAAIAGSPFAVGQPSDFVVLDPSNTLLYTVDSTGSRLSGFLVGADSSLTLGGGALTGSQMVVPNLPDFARFVF